MTAVELPELAGTQLVAFLLVLARVGGIFMFAPIFSSRLIAARARLVIAGAISVALTPIASRGQEVPTDLLAVAPLLVKEVVVGLGFALAIGVIAAAVQAAGNLLDTFVGFAFSAIVDPVSGQQAAVIGQFYSLFAVIVFVVTGGDHLMISGLAASYRVLPLDQVPGLGALAAIAADGLLEIFVIGLKIAAPVVLALLVVDAGLALISRAVPQMNVFFVGLPAKIMLGLAVIAASLPFVGTYIHQELERLVFDGLTGLRGG